MTDFPARRTTTDDSQGLICTECLREIDEGSLTVTGYHRVPMRNHGPDSTYFCGPVVPPEFMDASALGVTSDAAAVGCVQ